MWDEGGALLLRVGQGGALGDAVMGRGSTRLGPEGGSLWGCAVEEEMWAALVQ